VTNSRTFLCAPCRRVAKRNWFISGETPVCPSCREPMRNMGTRWRAPGRLNRRAWAAIDRGEYLWDRKARKQRHRRQQTWRGLYWTRPPEMAGHLEDHERRG
jgi:tRNA(Ile2) C34 agmatinyltransferase TiaS